MNQESDHQGSSHPPSLVEGDFFPLIEEEEDGVSSPAVISPRISKPVAVPPRRKKRISWADDTATGLATEFFLPNYIRTAAATVIDKSASKRPVQQPSIIFKERENGDGEKFLFFPSQRPSSRLLEMRTAAKGKTRVPFLPQPGSIATQPTILTRILPLQPRIVVDGKSKSSIFKYSLPLCPAGGHGIHDIPLQI